VDVDTKEHENYGQKQKKHLWEGREKGMENASSKTLNITQFYSL
jgi:hypothetical protein